MKNLPEKRPLSLTVPDNHLPKVKVIFDLLTMALGTYTVVKFLSDFPPGDPNTIISGGGAGGSLLVSLCIRTIINQKREKQNDEI